MDELVGKTVARWEYVDSGDEFSYPWPGEGIRLYFTDGSVFTAYEGQQAGEVRYKLKERE